MYNPGDTPEVVRSWQHSGTWIPAAPKFRKVRRSASKKSFELGSGSIESGGRTSPGVARRLEQGWTSRSREARLLAFVHLNVVL